jgi:integrase
MATANTIKPLTDAFVRKAREGVYPDAASPGLRLKVGVTKKTWLYRYRDPHTDSLKQVTLGQYPRLGLAAARLQWGDLSAARANGEDVQRVHQRAAEGEFTVTKLVDLYLDTYARAIKRSWQEDKRQLELDVVKRWGERPAHEITRPEVIALLTEVALRGNRAAELLLAAARKAWNHAIDHERLQANPWARLKVVRGVVMAAGTRVRDQKPRPRVLQGKELQTFLAKLPTAPLSQAIKDIFRLQLLTASRKGEVAAILWSEIDDEGVWTLPGAKAKNGQEHRVMLSRQALALIEAQPRTDEHVFPTRRGSGQIRPGGINAALKRALPHFGLPDFTPHALRHSALTLLSELGASREVQNRISNHADRSIAGLYDHNRRDEEAREWLQRLADHLDSLTAKNVVVLGGRRRG